MFISRSERRAAEAFAVALESGAAADPLVRLASRLTAVPLRSASQLAGAAGTPLFTAAVGSVVTGGMGTAVTGAVAPLAAPVATPAVASLLPAWAAGPAVQAVTGLLAVAVAVSGTGLAASRSLPGDPLYGIKRGVEQLQSKLAGGEVDQGVLSLDHAETRVDELLGLLSDPSAGGLDVDQVRATLRALEDELRRGTDLLLGAARGGATQAAMDLIEFTDAQVARLTDLLPQLPLLLRVDVARTLQLLEAAKAAALPAAGLPVSPVPSAPAVVPVPVPSKAASPAPSPSASTAPQPAPSGSTSPGPRQSTSSVSPGPSLPVPLPTPLLLG